MQHLLQRSIRLVSVIGQIGLPGLTSEFHERSSGRDPIRIGAYRIILESAGHIERLQTLRRRKKNRRQKFENVRI